MTMTITMTSTPTLTGPPGLAPGWLCWEACRTKKVKVEAGLRLRLGLCLAWWVEWGLRLVLRGPPHKVAEG